MRDNAHGSSAADSMAIDTAVVLAAGEGERLRPLTENRPKPMLSAGTRPILAYVFDALVDAGMMELHVVVGYGRERVQNHFGATYRDTDLIYHEQAKQLGTGHAVLQAREAIDEDFVVVNGDELVCAETVQSVVETHAMGTIATLAVFENDHAGECGVVRLDGDNVVELTEDPQRTDYGLLNRGVYALGPSIFETVESTDRVDGELRLTDAIARHVASGNSVRGVQTAGLWEGLTYPWHLLAVTTQVLRRGSVRLSEREPGVYVAASATVHPDATLRPPVALSDDAVVEPGAVVGPNAAVGQTASVGSNAVVRGSLVESDATVGANATLADTVIAEGATVGAGATLLGGPSTVRIGTDVYADCPLGVVVSDRAHVGGGTTISPGTLVGPNAEIAPGSTVTTNVDADTQVRN